jgi:hypothetical protein
MNILDAEQTAILMPAAADGADLAAGPVGGQHPSAMRNVTAGMVARMRSDTSVLARVPSVVPGVPRPHYERPQFVRPEVTCGRPA